MAVEMRKSRKRDLIASKRALRNPQTTEETSVCPTCGGKREDPDTQSLLGGPFTEILSMLPGEVRMEEPEQAYVEEPPRTQQVDKEGQTSEMDLSVREAITQVTAHPAGSTKASVEVNPMRRRPQEHPTRRLKRRRMRSWCCRACSNA